VRLISPCCCCCLLAAPIRDSLRDKVVALLVAPVVLWGCKAPPKEMSTEGPSRSRVGSVKARVSREKEICLLSFSMARLRVLLSMVLPLLLTLKEWSSSAGREQHVRERGCGYLLRFKKYPKGSSAADTSCVIWGDVPTRSRGSRGSKTHGSWDIPDL
jgi:hypothetical protein